MKPSPNNNLGSYATLLDTFQQQGYEFVFFQEQNQSKGQIILRHDIDFDTKFALDLAEIEHKKGIKATYFFLMRSHFYNIFSPEDYDNILKIQAMGHQVSVHFDPTIYEDFREGLKKEVNIFEQYFGCKVEIISLHRPSEFFLQHDESIAGIEHTYQSKYFKDVKYFSDSTGIWRYGCPTDSEEFQQHVSLHVLTHPVWWIVEGASNLDKLSHYFSQRTNDLKQDFFDNCIPFRKIYAKL